MPVAPATPTQYYARCVRTTGTRVCLSDKSQNVTVTIVALTSFYSIQSGNWHVPATWNCTCIPDGTLPVQIMDSHTVTIPNAYTGQAKGMQFIGTGQIRQEGTGRVNMLN